jgi:hydrogenase maturation protein HypF
VPAVADRRRVRVRVEGVVQGVGFRPYVYRLAREHDLDGLVRNDEHGVVVEAEGAPDAVEAFLARLPAEAPPMARVELVRATDEAPRAGRGFAIVASAGGGVPDAPVSADTATCQDCLAELLDPANRRYRYPFINCTNCGPRFTIVRGVPYDRPYTTMAGFEMCSACQAEYDDPADRRFHAQPNACPECGPSLDPALEVAVSSLRSGRVVAVKGLGGYHLACLAADEAAVAELRGRKHREDKPFAVMSAHLESARSLVELSDDEAQLLTAPARPILVARRRPDARVAAAVAPGRPDLGVMLPYTPLHHLLLNDVGEPLVMTSGNVSDEPIAYEDADARGRLASIADVFVAHDRPIHIRTDDSVVRSTGVGPVLLRRSRGHVPEALTLPIASVRPLLACGAQLKSTFCVAKGRRAWVSHHIGDLENWETLRSFSDGVEHFERLFAVRPEVISHDLHAGYLSTKYALEREDVELVGVQHHHAHLAACLAEHGMTGPAVGAIYDGTGDGGDGTVWGGEILAGDLRSFTRAGALWPVRLPGGERAIRQPWRMACAWLLAADAPVPGWLSREPSWDAVSGLAQGGPHSPQTTSMGRLFDAVAAMCGLRTEVTYEGQAAAELEAACDLAERGSYPLPWVQGVLDARETVRALAGDVTAGVATGAVAMRFHRAVAEATAQALAVTAQELGVQAAVLSGGVFQNRVLLELSVEELRKRRLTVLWPRRLPPNDGGISFGQAAVAAARMEGN